MSNINMNPDERLNHIFNPLINEISEEDIENIQDPIIKKFVGEFKKEIKEIKEEYQSTSITVGHKRFYMDGYLQKVFNHFIKSVKHKWDYVLNIDGVEGSAKSTIGKACAWYMTKKYNPKNEFTNENIVFTPEQFFEAVDKLPPGSAILWDEFVFGGLSTDMGTVQNSIIKKFTLIRKKRLFIIVVIPYIWMLRTYFAIGRTRNLLHVYSDDFISRGKFAFYGFKQKHKLFFDGHQGRHKWQYKVEPDFSGQFLKDIAQPNFFTDDAEYEAKKDAASESIGKDSQEKEEKKLEREKYARTTLTCRNPLCKIRGLYREKETNKLFCKKCESTFTN